jgi:hypothetical protein
MSTFDLIGDIHGCFDEAVALIEKLGYRNLGGIWKHPENRTLVFLGDITDRGPKNREALQMVIRNFDEGNHLWVMGNHDNKLFRWMKGNPIKPAHGLEGTIEDLTPWPFDEDREAMGQRLLDQVPTQLTLDEGKLIAVHAAPSKNKSTNIYGPKKDNERVPWWETWEGPFVVFGHYWMMKEGGSFLCIDSECCAGGSLTAYRWPERETVQVKAFDTYWNVT